MGLTVTSAITSPERLTLFHNSGFQGSFEGHGTKFEKQDWKATEISVRKRSVAQSFLVVAMALLGCVLGFFLIGRKEQTVVRADPGVTTETAAVAAGARVTPTEPKLRIEPK